MKRKITPILAAFAVTLSALASTAMAVETFTYDAKGNLTHIKGIPIEPIPTVEQARAATEKRIAEIKAEEAKQAAQAATTSNLQSEIGNHQLFYTGKPYLEETGQYLFLFRHYDPELARWTTADPSGFPDWPNNYLYAMNPFSGLDPDGKAWAWWNYVIHYFTQSGRPVTLSEIGHLNGIKSAFHGGPETGGYRFGNQLDAKAQSWAPFNGTLPQVTVNTYDFADVSWPIRRATVVGSIAAEMQSSDPDSNGRGTWSYAGTAAFQFSDLFSDPLSVIQAFGGYDALPSGIRGDIIKAVADGVGTAFTITGSWTHPYNNSGAYYE